ncbi:hypothetical protein BISA_1116 [Bifidobacterium saguini DSM 23967]|uniref:DUF559 domain-containing protein n=3 Tax=Bifidobacterium saguini TaxID=762210 RepID=A0A087D8H8_9BIFI|nr:hypothetical protein [Bifidobacterium saguini]KFI91828.1 hypothetical protein BISA_1116 [Bifidobacterium saguini DSM 23967]
MSTYVNESSMRDSLDNRRRETLNRCIEEANRIGRNLLFGMTTALILYGVPLPADCDLDTSQLHTVFETKEKRLRTNSTTLCPHVWKFLPQSHAVKINTRVYALDIFHVWAQMASHVSLQSLIVLGDSIISVMSRRRQCDMKQIYCELVRFTQSVTGFAGRPSCIRALSLIMPGASSPKESEKRISLCAHGIPQPKLNYVVPNIMFDSGVVMTLDLAWPEYKVAVEYDGDQHRTDKMQWRRDREKRGKLVGRGWLIFTATAASLADDDARAEFAFHVGRALTLRGADFVFRLKALPLELMAPLPRKVDWTALESKVG